ncbi:MAG: Nif3-like dinuclear metal center hexameric protein [Candidatus Heimdallarchaeota archaeon]|nr:Nif3-like dinuclear metal center hexameric protein [Candidatus Heimdallarchaeota archaeon]MCK4876515.1 Nif3-like dinuclear metal center hexameric protein [Candidatus Heimdallarchaeota archaeon]
MTKTLEEIIASLRNLTDKEVYQSSDFGIEFGTYAPRVLSAINVKSIVVSPFVNLRLIHFMNENKANLVLTVLPLPFTTKNFPLSESNFEILRSLVTNNIKTIKLPEKWIYAKNGSFKYFVQTLGISKIEPFNLTLNSEKTIPYWNLPNLSFEDFLSSLSHSNKKWLTYPYAPGDSKLSIVLERHSFSQNDFEQLKKNNISTILSFNLDTRRAHEYQKHKINYVFIPFLDYCNISLRKFSQILQLETNEKVLFYPHETINWKSYEELKLN